MGVRVKWGRVKWGFYCINMSKCCYIIFKPNTNNVDQPYPNFELKIGDNVIKNVKHTTFLGVTIDEKLNWEKHITDLKRRLYHALSTIKRIKPSVPQSLHKDLYHTLFESHLTYCISVWGGLSVARMDCLFKIQKKILRILYGDTKAYIEKFKTCVRVRPFGNQKLGEEFYMKEHTKPLFEKHKILTVHNIYSYHTFMEILKILKFKMPISILEHYQHSRRNCYTYPQLVPPAPSTNFIYRSSTIWNLLRKKLGLTDLSVKASLVKNKLKAMLHHNQHIHNKLEWYPSHDFNIELINTTHL